MRQPSMSPGIASRRSAMTVSKEWLDTEIAERSKEPHRTMYSRTLLDALKELASRRAAGEGAVTVEGERTAHDWGARLEAQLAPKDAEPILRGDDTTAAVTVTIRRKP